MSSVSTSTTRLSASVVEAVGLTRIRSVGLWGERYIDLRVTVIRVACSVRVGVVLVKILAWRGVVIVATI